MNNHPNSHPLYQSLGNPPNIQLLDTMFQMQPTEAQKAATLIPTNYTTYAAEMQLAPGGHHAMNLAQAHVVSSANEIGGQPVIIYQQGEQPQQQQQQQQPISYKIPQMDHSAQLAVSRAAEEQKKKDIVAEAASKIFDESTIAKKSAAPTPSTSAGLPTAVKSEPNATPGPSGSKVTPSKPIVRTGGPVSVGRPRGGGRMQRQQILPRLQLLEDEDDGLTCRMCLQSFWYKAQLIDHLKANHSITDPERYEREEREKKMRRIREDQQRNILGRRQRHAANIGKFRGRPGRPGPGGRPMPRPSGPRPSFQYRDGAFICDLCKKSFSDGNDMVTHWKSHVKKQRLGGSPGGFPRGRGRPRSPSPSGSGRGGRSDKGKPRWTAYLVWSTRRRKELSEEEPDLTFGEIAKTISVEWKEVTEEDKDRFQHQAEQMNYAGVRKMFKSRSPNYEEGYDNHYESDIDWSADEDPDFEEKIVKPIMLKIKKEGDDDKPRSARKRKRPSFFQEFENEENNLDKILDEFEQEQMEEAKKPRPEKPKPPPKPDGEGGEGGEGAAEGKEGGADGGEGGGEEKPKKVRKRRKKKEMEPEPEEEEEPVELEKSRSGRIRKKPKFYNYFKIDGEAPEEGMNSDDDDSEDRDEYKPEDSEPEEDNEIDEDEVVDSDDSTTDSDSSSGQGDDSLSLPPKKRGNKKIMTSEEIEEFTRRALTSRMHDSDDSDETTTDSDDDDDDEDDLPRSSITITKIPVKKEAGEESKGSEEQQQTSANAEEQPKETSDQAAEAEGNEPSEGIITNEESNKEQDKETQDQVQEGTAEPAPEEQGSEEVAEPAVEEAAQMVESVPAEPEAAVVEESVPVQEEQPQEAAEASEAPQAEPPADDNDLLSQMEDGDDKFKDIIAEGQMDQIFP